MVGSLSLPRPRWKAILAATVLSRWKQKTTPLDHDPLLHQYYPVLTEARLHDRSPLVSLDKQLSNVRIRNGQTA